ncbi:MAG: hypothetical protein E7B03_01400 [Negativicoccus succinicivorans]|nr:hypothetical protein [Negativicoccus succinicivorans]MDU4202646.1 hypothetical protein [Negativicoccus succinicivorans]
MNKKISDIIFALCSLACIAGAFIYYDTNADMQYEYLYHPFLHTVPIVCSIIGYSTAFIQWKLKQKEVTKELWYVICGAMFIVLWLFLPKPETFLEITISVGMAYCFIIGGSLLIISIEMLIFFAPDLISDFFSKNKNKW